jgi:iron-sulfur cluster assembly accessory protein
MSELGLSLPCQIAKLDDFPITLTDKAVDMALAALSETNGEDGEFLRVSIRGGGCAGFQYALNFVNEVDENDILTHNRGLQVVADIFSATQIGGAVVDYVESLQGAGFKFENPNAKRTCGCGSSFSA